ncbi:MAG TPA: hypothetical protein VGQ00_03830 [Candidatus Norongarragalinales archaeon]|jgi:archaellum component FlaC|nr:hypothetical protein [Candidatus Norongarragalinales archaeon]
MAPETRDALLASVKSDLQTLDSKINLLNEKIRTIERNEEVIGRTIVALNEKVKKLETSAAEGGGGPGGAIDDLKAAVEELRKNMASKQEVQEVRYLLDTINPLEFATLDQVRELLKEELARLKQTKP